MCYTRLIAMVTAYVLVRAHAQRIKDLGEEIAEIPQVTEVYSVTGPYDFIVVLKLKDIEELEDAITKGILQLEGVERTKTLLAFRHYPKKLLDQGFGID
jgi:DNA-binding Lrp family transcriptional regulator